uniref:Uncharacterized protein n=1 Tax=Arundo donax TaxID=35708 RepID=A0A0A9FPZ9_ARUDO
MSPLLTCLLSLIKNVSHFDHMLYRPYVVNLSNFFTVDD